MLKLLYQFTRDDRCKSLLTYQENGLLMLLQLCVHFPDPHRVGKDLVALLINLALHPRAAELMVVCSLETGNGTQFLWPQVVLRVLKTRDPLLCRVVRYCASHQNVRNMMQRLLSSDQVLVT